jgi:serine protease Do
MMSDLRLKESITRRRSARAVVVAVALIASGAVWHGWAAETPTSTPAVSARGAVSAIDRRDSYADIVEKISPAVVTVYTEGRATKSRTSAPGGDEKRFRRFFGDRFGQRFEGQGPASSIPRRRGQASGVVVGRDGHILTNAHVVDGAQTIRVEFSDGRTLDATVVGADQPSDLALLEVEAADLAAVSLGDSDAVRVGDVVLAFGNPLGVGQTVTMGIISAKGRVTGVGEGSYEDFIQTDAPINHGNSGGALVNTRGELVGINSQILSRSDGNIGIGFAIPANMARNVMADLREHGRVRRGQLGVTVQAVSSDLAASLGLADVGGAIVSSVTPGSAAERAGIRQGDVIESFNGKALRDTNALRNHVAEVSPGSRATVTIRRDGSSQELTVTLDGAKSDRARSVDDQTTEDHAALGVAVAPLTPEVASQVGVPANVRGLVVQDVNPDGRAAAAGIRSGDVIERVDRKPVRSVDELRASIVSAGDRPLLLLINREGNALFVAVRPTNS